MRAILVRVAVDKSWKGGHWNAPVDPESGQFVYVPIPEKDGTPFLPGLAYGYNLMMPALNGFCQLFSVHRSDDLKFPETLEKRHMHLDPDFEHLTYGDRGDRRGAGIREMQGRAADLLIGGVSADDERAALSEQEQAAEEEAQIAAVSEAARGPTDTPSAKELFQREQQLLDEMTEIGESTKFLPDARVKKLLDWIRE